MYAIVEISGKQYKVRANDRLYVPVQKAEAQASLTFDNVLLVAGEDRVDVGQPTVDGASVSATVIEHVKADKVLVFKKKRRKHYRVKRGHRQPYTHVLIEGIELGGSKKKKKVAKAVPVAEVVAEPAPAPVAAPAPAPKAAPAPAAAPKAAPAPAPVAAPAPAAAPKAAPKAKAAPKTKAAPKAKAKKGDDLTKIEGIGPKYAEVFGAAGIDSFATMADTSAEKLTEILIAASTRYRNAVTETWPEQAALAAAGDWDTLKTLQDELDGGRRA